MDATTGRIELGSGGELWDAIQQHVAEPMLHVGQTIRIYGIGDQRTGTIISTRPDVVVEWDVEPDEIEIVNQAGETIRMTRVATE
jgi:hypothetical protein